MFEIVLTSIIGIFFLGNGIYNFFNEALVTAHLQKKEIDHAQQLTRIAGISLVIFGTAFMIESVQMISIIGLSLYLLISALLIHQFWNEKDELESMNSLLHFGKNIVLIILLFTIGIL